MDCLTTIPEYIEFNNNELEKIKVRSLQSRIKNDCKLLYEDYHDVLVDLTDNDKITISAVEIISYSKKRTYKFILTNQYPFRPPKIYINDQPYLNILQLRGDYEKDMVKKIKGQDCLCCHSMSCSANWSPAIKLLRIIDEIKDTLKFKRDIINVLLADKIKKKYNMPYAHFEAYLI